VAAASCLLLGFGIQDLHAQAPATANSPEWAKIVEAAKKEGEVVVWSQAGNSRREFAKDSFEKAYPNIKVNLFQAATSVERDSRYVQEFKAGLAKVDVMIGGSLGAVANIKPIGGLKPIKPMLREDILDVKNWADNKLLWGDKENQYMLISDGLAYPAVTVNRTVKAAELQNWEQLLDPKYDGKIVMRDPRGSGSGYAATLFLYYSPELGPEFVDRFFKNGRIVFSSDERQNVEWIDSGRMLIGVYARWQEVEKLQEVGGRLTGIPFLKAKGKAIASVSSTDGIAFLPKDPVPHPNAAQVYVNWFYSKEGQQALVNTIKTSTYHKQVDLKQVSEMVRQRAGVEYRNMNDEFFSAPQVTKDMRDAVTKAIGKK
jgi:ABC-type Fe3+ transport system substrate-binding protein